MENALNCLVCKDRGLFSLAFGLDFATVSFPLPQHYTGDSCVINVSTF